MQISTLLSCAFRNLRVDWCKSSRVTCSKWVSSVGFSIFFPPCCTAPLKFKFTFHKVPRRPWLCPSACAFEIHWLAAVQTLEQSATLTVVYFFVVFPIGKPTVQQTHCPETVHRAGTWTCATTEFNQAHAHRKNKKNGSSVARPCGATHGVSFALHGATWLRYDLGNSPPVECKYVDMQMF